MAKKTKTINNTTLTIDANSKSTVWAYEGSTIKTFSLITKPTENYTMLGTIYVQEGKDLNIITKYRNEIKGNIRTISNKIKDYYSDNPKGIITINSNPVAITDTYKKDDLITISAGDSINYLYTDKKSSYNLTGSGEYGANIYATKGNNNYNINNALTEGYNKISDFDGNDNYNFASSTSSSSVILDYTGKDSYFSKNNSKISISDYLGNDKYSLVNSSVFISDYSGKDSYEIASADELYLYDIKGNDSYKLTSSSSLNQTINDIKGKDKYNIISSSNLLINESDIEQTNKSGTDSYNIISSNNIEIKETSKFSGNDSYNFNFTNNSGYSASDEILDCAGNDKYKIKSSQNINFTDKAGNDSYILDNSDNIKIIDSKGKDKYNIINNSTGANITDSNGADTYKAVNSSDLTINDLLKSNDKYVLENVYNLNITDDGGKDSYIINNLSGQIKIEDLGGYDKITINHTTKADLIFMAGNRWDESFNSLNDDNSLYIFDKKNGGFLNIGSFFKTKDGSISDFGEGRIESVKAGKKEIGNLVDFKELNSLKSTVASWLKTNNYCSVENVLDGNNKDDINNLIAVFEKTA